MTNSRYSLYAYFVSVVLMAYAAFFYYPKWKSHAGESSLGYDASTYYWYLPSTFIYHDLKQQGFGDSVIEEYKFTSTFEQSYVHKSGNRVITYSSGVALMELPAFAVAHILAKPLGYEADGFSRPYQVTLVLWTLCWIFFGLWLYRKLMLYYYDDRVVAITILRL